MTLFISPTKSHAKEQRFRDGDFNAKRDTNSSSMNTFILAQKLEPSPDN